MTQTVNKRVTPPPMGGRGNAADWMGAARGTLKDGMNRDIWDSQSGDVKAGLAAGAAPVAQTAATNADKAQADAGAAPPTKTDDAAPDPFSVQVIGEANATGSAAVTTPRVALTVGQGARRALGKAYGRQ